jgi:hypothetical protein
MRWKWQRRPRPADLGVHVVQLVAAADLHQQDRVEVLALEPPPGALQPAEHRCERGIGRGGLRHEQRRRVEVRVPDRPALAIAPAGPEEPHIPMQKPLRQRRQRWRRRRQHARGTRPQRAPRDGAAPRSLQPHRRRRPAVRGSRADRGRPAVRRPGRGAELRGDGPGQAAVELRRRRLLGTDRRKLRTRRCSTARTRGNPSSPH